MPDPLPIQAKHDVKLLCGSDRALAARVDATAKQYDVPRVAVIRAALDQKLQWVLGGGPAYWQQPSDPQRLRLFVRTIDELRRQVELEGLDEGRSHLYR